MTKKRDFYKAPAGEESKDQHGQKRNGQRLSSITTYRAAPPYSPQTADHFVNFRPHMKNSHFGGTLTLKGVTGHGHSETFRDEINRKHVIKPSETE